MAEPESQRKEIKIQAGWIDLSTAAQYSSLSRSTLKRAVSAGKLKAGRGTGKLLFRAEWLDRLIYFGDCRRLNPTERKSLSEL